MDESVFRAGDLVVDLNQNAVTKGGVPVPLSFSEWRLLEALALRAGRVVPHDVLLLQVWGRQYQSDYQFLRAWIGRLRAKVETDPAGPLIIVSDAAGYAFRPDFDLN
jgi:two-component system KDP operon response regulator KdpE